MEDITNLDLYELIGATPAATIPEIKKAYRKKALSCHPDKNPDNPKAAELFHQLSRALEILTDESARAAYDKVIRAKEEAKLRTKELDFKRRKLKEDLEAREEAYRRSQSNEQYSSSKSDEQRLKAEIERLKKEGSKQVEEEIAFINRKIAEQLSSERGRKEFTPEHKRVKIRWKAEKGDEKNGGYDYDTLHRILSKHGDIDALVMSHKKGRALVEYDNHDSAKNAATIEVGLAENPLILEGMWNSEKGAKTKSNSTFNQSNYKTSLFPSTQESRDSETNTFPSFSSAPNIFATRSGVSDAEFESTVLGNLRRAEERKKLIEQMKAEDET